MACKNDTSLPRRGNAPAIQLATDPLTGWQDGITPDVQEKLSAAAQAIRLAIVAVEAAHRATERKTDAQRRRREALRHLEHEALFQMEWLQRQSIEPPQVESERCLRRPFAYIASAQRREPKSEIAGME